MKISNILPLMGYKEGYRIKNEKEFDFLCLSSHELDMPCCIFIESEKFINNIPKHVTMILAPEELSSLLLNQHFGVCLIKQPRIVFFKLHNYLSQIEGYKRFNKKTTIGENCLINELSSIAEHNVSIGNDVIIEEFVVIRENTVIGDRSIIRSGSIIGGQGFEFKRQEKGVLSVEHVGGVIIGNDVELQYHNCVDCAIYPWDNTTIGDFVKIDNMVHIAHAVKIESNVMIAACSLIAGRTKVKKNVWIGPGVVISNGITIGDSARVNIGSVSTTNVTDGQSVTGNFAITHDKFIRNLKNIIHHD